MLFKFTAVIKALNWNYVHCFKSRLDVCMCIFVFVCVSLVHFRFDNYMSICDNCNDAACPCRGMKFKKETLLCMTFPAFTGPVYRY